MSLFPLPIFPYQKKYFSFFSSFYNLTTTNPQFMSIPIDDHGFHRGDGVFEAIKWINGKPWILDQHLDRLFHSAKAIFLNVPYEREFIKNKVLELISMSHRKSGLVRIYVTRGPGSFGVSAKDTIGEQLYVVTTELNQVSEDKVQKGVRLTWSQIKPKESIFATTKTLNYLPNVLMKKECEDQGLDFVVGVNEAGFITESYTENIFFIRDDCLYHPYLNSILKGTSLFRLIELITNKTVKDDSLPVYHVYEKNIKKDDLLLADGVFVIGTTIDLLWVHQLEYKAFVKPDYFDILRDLLIKDQN